MTKDELEVLILKSKDLMKLANAFSGMDEKERKALSTHAQSVHNQLEKHKINKSASPRIAKHIKARKGEVWNHWNAADTINARLAVLALGPLTAVKKLHLSWYQDDGKSMNKILTDRKPEWINEWIEHDLEQEFSSLDFGTIWAWMKIGICDEPKGDGFFFKFANYMQSTGVYGRGPGTPISTALKAEPKLKEYVSPGLKKEPLKITKPGLRLCLKCRKPVILIGRDFWMLPWRGCGVISSKTS